MKITVESETANLHSGRFPVTRVNGVEIKHCTVADTDEGYADELDIEASRGRGGDLVIKRHHGTVTINYVDRDGNPIV